MPNKVNRLIFRSKELTANGIDGIPIPLRYFAMSTMALAVTMSGLDNSIVNVALPTISRSLNTAPADTVLIVSSYQVAMAVSLLPLASLGEIYGYRRIYLFGLAVFTAASLAVSLAHTLPLLSFWRTIQGFGAAGVLSVNIAILRFVYPRTQLGRGIGINAFVAAVSATAGPPIGSLLMYFMDWHGLFAINVPIGLIALVLAYLSVPNTPRASRRFDLVGATFSVTTVALLLLFFQSFAHETSKASIAIIFLSFVIIGSMQIRYERQKTSPLLPIDLFRIPLFRLSVLTSICAFSAQMQAFVALPFFLEYLLELHDSSVGFLIAPWPTATIFAAITAGRLSDHISAGALGMAGLLVFSAGLTALAFLPNHPATMDIIWRMMLCGAGFGLFQSPNNRILISSAPASRSGSASGMLGTARLLGQSIGGACAAGSLTMFGLQGAVYALLIGSGIAVLAAIFSAARLLTSE